MARRVHRQLVFGAVLGAIGCSSSPPESPHAVLALRFSRCAFSGTLAAATETGDPVPVASAGTCVGGAFDGGGHGPALDIDITTNSSRAESLALTVHPAAAGRTLTLGAPPAGPADENAYVGVELPAGEAWIRHYGGSAGGTYAALMGSITLGPIELTTHDCTADYCSKGQAKLTVTLDDVRWESPSGTIRYSGQVVVSASAGDTDDGGAEIPCTGASGCEPGSACNNLVYSEEKTTCGVTNPTGRDLGEPCGSDLTCQSNFCASPGQCASICESDAECTNGTSCQERTQTKTFRTDQCIKRCDTDADCATLPDGAVCVPHPSPDETTLVGGCDAPSGLRFGQPADPELGCDSGLEASVAGQGSVCTRLCVTSADCAAPLPTCVAGTYVFSRFRAGGTGSAVLRACR